MASLISKTAILTLALMLTGCGVQTQHQNFSSEASNEYDFAFEKEFLSGLKAEMQQVSAWISDEKKKNEFLANVDEKLEAMQEELGTKCRTGTANACSVIYIDTWLRAPMIQLVQQAQQHVEEKVRRMLNGVLYNWATGTLEFKGTWKGESYVMKLAPNGDIESYYGPEEFMTAYGFRSAHFNTIGRTLLANLERESQQIGAWIKSKADKANYEIKSAVLNRLILGEMHNKQSVSFNEWLRSSTAKFYDAALPGIEGQAKEALAKHRDKIVNGELEIHLSGEYAEEKFSVWVGQKGEIKASGSELFQLHFDRVLEQFTADE